jgi:hypothetical protein
MWFGSCFLFIDKNKLIKMVPGLISSSSNLQILHHSFLHYLTKYTYYIKRKNIIFTVVTKPALQNPAIRASSVAPSPSLGKSDSLTFCEDDNLFCLL